MNAVGFESPGSAGCWNL